MEVHSPMAVPVVVVPVQLLQTVNVKCGEDRKLVTVNINPLFLQ